MITYFIIGFFVAAINYVYRSIDSELWLYAQDPSLVKIFVWIVLWPFVVAMLIFDWTMKLLDYIADSDIWVSKKNRDE